MQELTEETVTGLLLALLAEPRLLNKVPTELLDKAEFVLTAELWDRCINEERE
jgi:hypothetical protein